MAFFLVSETLGPYNDRIKKFVSARAHSGPVSSWNDVQLSKMLQHLQEFDHGNPSQILLVFWSSVMHASGALPCSMSNLFSANDAANSLESILGCHFMYAMSLRSETSDEVGIFVYTQHEFGGQFTWTPMEANPETVLAIKNENPAKDKHQLHG